MSESPGKMYALATTMLVVAVVPVILRFRVRIGNKHPLGMDDWLMIPALLGTIGTVAAVYYATVNGGLGLHTPVEPDGKPNYTKSTELFLKASFVTLLTQVVTLGCTKLSVLYFYRRIFLGQIFNIASWSLIVITFIWTIGFFFANLFECMPIELNWAGSGYSGSCINEPAMYLWEAWSDVIIDVLVLALPIPIIWKLQLRPIQKIALSALFFLGALVIFASISRLVVYYHVIYIQNTFGMADLTWLLAPTFYWPLIESSLGILGACVLSLRPMFRGTSPKSVVKSIRTAFSFESLRGVRRPSRESSVERGFQSRRNSSPLNRDPANFRMTEQKGNVFHKQRAVDVEPREMQNVIRVDHTFEIV